MTIDFHSHLDWYQDLTDLQQQLINFNGTIVAASVNLDSYRQCLKITEITNNLLNSSSIQKIIPTLGIHPQYADSEFQRLSEYQPFLNQSKIIGEIGMDFCWTKSSPLAQEKCFRFFLDHCNKTGKYCVIHTKDAENQISQILSEYPQAKPIIHWYDGPENTFQEFIHRGYHFTFGNETIRSSFLQKLLAQVPLNKLLLETDNPSSEPWLIKQYKEHGSPNTSINLINRVYTETAEILHIPEEKLRCQIEKNFRKIIES